MTYSKNSTITIADFNTFAGRTDVSAGSSLTATNKAGYLYGIGYADRGYGQSTPTLVPKSAGQTVGQEWQDLRTIISSLANWQNTSTLLLPPSSSFNSSAPIKAHERDTPSSNAYDIQDLLALLDSNRFNYQVGNMTLTAGVVSTTRSTTWGAGVGSISCEFGVTFASEDAARYFFNTGGDIRLGLANPNTSTPRDTAWNTILSNLVIAFKANETSRLTGSYGTAQSIGYYQLTTSYQTILDGTNSGVGAYTVNDFIIQAKASTITGTNGAKGSVILFKIVLTDEQVNPFSDIVQAGAVATLSHLRATTTYSIAAPFCNVVTAF